MKLPVVNKELAQKIGQAEIDFFCSRIHSIGERSGNPEGAEVKRFGHATAFYIRTMPWGLFNSVKGFAEEDMDRLDDLIHFYQIRERKFQLDVNPHEASPALFKLLAEKGLRQESFHAVLYGMPNPDAPELPEGIAIREITDEADFDLYAGIHCVGSGMNIEHKHHFANNNKGLLNRPGWKLYLADLHGRPAAVGVMFCRNNTASFTLAATAPPYRRQGLQTALLQWRMHQAYREGCELVVGQASFGSISQNNMERVGMQLAWTRAVMAPNA